MYWHEEQSVSTVSTSTVRGHCTMAIGDHCEITVGNNEYNGKVAAKGERIIHTIQHD